MTRTKVLLALFLLIAAAMPMMAQEQTAFIQGGVIDTSGAALPGVTIEAVSAKGQRFSTVSDSSGHYRFPALPPGTYTITGSLSGMQSSTVKNIVLTLGSAPKIDLALKVAAVAETLTVTAEAPIVDMSSNATAASIRSESFEKLPKGRDFTSIVTQAAAANQDNKAGGITVDGASGSENVYVLDGVDTTNPQTGVSGKIMITDFVDEVQVKSAGYAAEFGGAIGGVINVVSKTGTNDFRGSATVNYTPYSMNGAVRPTLEVNTTAAGDVTSYVTYPKDEGHTVEPGFTIGGPLMKDSLWFFAGYDPIMQTTDRTPQGWTTTYSQDFKRDNGIFNLNGVAGSKLTYKASYNTSGYKTTNLLPNANGRSSTTASNYEGKDDKLTNWTASGYVDFVATPQFFMSAKGGRFDRNYTQQGISSDVRYLYSGGSPSVFPDAPAAIIHPSGWSNIPTNSASVMDKYVRDNLDLDASFFPQWMGSHRIKVGAQFTNLKNDVFNGEQNLLLRFYWNRAEPNTGVKGTYGALRMRQFGTFGDVSSKNSGLFIQDSWTTLNDRLTLNIGVRAEDEKVPSYATEGVVATNAIHWTYGDKLAPRLGFSYDIKGDGRTKLYGSYGKFYDIMKMELPRGSFGGDKWIDSIFKLETLDIFNMNCTGYSPSINTRPTCKGAIWQTNRDYRHPSNSADNNLIDPNIKPMQSQEFTIGAQHEMSQTLAFGVRYVRKNLVRTIEDSGVLVTQADGSTAEQYFIANPGEGVAKYILGTSFPALPKPKREYNGFELEATKRFANRWSLHATYLYSTLKGNYSGLANSDEAQATPGTARTSPNVNRAFDNLFNLFDDKGQPVTGNLATDRPHQIKAQVAYSFPFGLTAGLNQYSASGTPFSTEFYYEGVPYFAYGRGDMGRSPWFNQTDLNLVQDFKLAGRYTLQFGVNVLNLFDSKTAVNIYDQYSQDSLAVSNTNFFKGFDPKAQCAAQKCTLDASYGKANTFQSPREVRFSARLLF